VEKKMIMVDQRWLWLVETRDVKSDAPDKIKTSIFTSFPRKEREAGAAEKDLEDIADLRQATMDEANSMGIEWATNKCSYVGPVIEQAVSIFSKSGLKDHLTFLAFSVRPSEKHLGPCSFILY
jgi:hypothetical protein